MVYFKEISADGSSSSVLRKSQLKKFKKIHDNLGYIEKISHYESQKYKSLLFGVHEGSNDFILSWYAEELRKLKEFKFIDFLESE